MLTNGTADRLPARDSRDARYLKNVANKCAFLFAIALFGYPVVGSIISLLQIDSRALSVPFRIGVALFSVWVILTTRRLRIDGLRLVMLLIWFFYIIRLLHDWLVSNLQGADYALQFFIASAVLPGFALLKARGFEWRRFALVAFMVASAGALLGLFGALLGGADVQDPGGPTDRLGLSALNPVSLGNQATSAILCGAVLWREATTRQRLILAGAVALLLACLVLTGSKGPLLQLLVCAGLWAIRRGYVWRLGVLGLPVILGLALSTDNPLANRLADSGDDTSTFQRLEMINDSVVQIQGSPWMGSAFVELNSGFYPHDVFVEAGLAFGVPGALVFAGMFSIGAFRAWKTLTTNYDLLGLLFFQAVLDASIAGSIYGMTLLWVILTMLPTASALAARKRLPMPPRAAPAVSS